MINSNWDFQKGIVASEKPSERIKSDARMLSKMKIILSRKGFDDSNGGCASPILPDGTMLSMPIPSVEDDILYDQLQYNGINYADILKQINPKNYSYTTCHLIRYSSKYTH